jgi:phytoene desaturase
MDRPKRVVIVGAGPGGLASAMLLRKAGLEVTVVEKRHGFGGRTGQINADGFKFDVGPTFFLYPQVLEQIFSAAGYDLMTEVPMERLDPQYRIIFENGGEISATPNVERMKQAIARISPRDAEHLDDYLADNRRKLAAFTPTLQKPFNSWRDALTPEMLRMAPLLRPWNSLDRELSRYFHDPRVRLAFSFQSKYLGMSPFRCPGLFSILSFLEYEHGVFHPYGGCHAIMRKMAELAAEMGVEFLMGQGVDQIEFADGRATGVRVGGHIVRSDAVVINADFAHAMTHLVPGKLRRRWTDRKIAKARYSCSTFMLYLGLDGAAPPLAHHNIFLVENYRDNLADIDSRHVLSSNPSFYVQNACVTDPSLAPRGCSTLYALAPVSHLHPNIDWAKEAPRFREILLKQIQRLGITDLKERIRFEKMITPVDWNKDYSIYRGATFNLTHDFRQMLHMRPRNRFDELAGVYLVGGGTHPGSGLPVIFESARISSRLLLEDFGYGERWTDLQAAMARIHTKPTLGCRTPVAIPA